MEQSLQNVLDSVDRLWQQVESLTREAENQFGPGHRAVESLDFASIHMMNCQSELEEIRRNEKHRLQCQASNPNWITERTLRQILDVLAVLRSSGHRSFGGLVYSYQDAVNRVAESYSVQRNAIADGCTRRLRQNRNDFLQIVVEWLGGSPERLSDMLRSHTDWGLHQMIQRFFASNNDVEKPQ